MSGQQFAERPSFWAISTSASIGDPYFMYSVGGAYIARDHHAFGLNAGLVPGNFFLHPKSHPGAGADYTYYFRPLSNKTFNVFVAVALDYHRYMYENRWLDAQGTQRQDKTVSNNWYTHAGGGFSLRFLKRFTGQLSVSYLFGDSYQYRYMYNDVNGEPRQFRSSATTLGSNSFYFPLRFKAGLSYLFVKEKN
jgi:hypothetical protein